MDGQGGTYPMFDLTRTPATDALLDATARHDAGSWLVPGGQAALVAGIAGDHPDAVVRWLPIDVRERDAVAPARPNVVIEAPGTSGEAVEAVALVAVPDRNLVRRWLLTAHAALVTGGRLFLAGANSEGIRSVIGDATMLFGAANREDARARGRLAVFSRTDAVREWPAWSAEPGIAPASWQAFSLDIGGTSLPIVTQPGVFAGGKVDAGTRHLLDALPDFATGRVLDVGCGAGLIGIAAAHLGTSSVDLIDVNLLAVQAAKENIRRLGLDQCRVLAGDVYPGGEGDRYDLIVSNPPFHRGKAIDYTVADRLIGDAHAHLRPGGSLLIVANAFLAYGRRLERVFGEVEANMATRQFHVFRASAPR